MLDTLTPIEKTNFHFYFQANLVSEAEFSFEEIKLLAVRLEQIYYLFIVFHSLKFLPNYDIDIKNDLFSEYTPRGIIYHMYLLLFFGIIIIIYHYQCLLGIPLRF